MKSFGLFKNLSFVYFFFTLWMLLCPCKVIYIFCVTGGEHLEAFRSFLDKVEQIQPQAGVWAPKGRSRQQELYPGSGLFLSSTHLAAIHATTKKDCLCLFHLLFDEFFTAEDCQNAVAFGKHRKVPDWKRVLDKFKVNAILSKYVAHVVVNNLWKKLWKFIGKKCVGTQ